MVLLKLLTAMMRFWIYLQERFNPLQTVTLAAFLGVAIGTMAPVLAGHSVSIASIFLIIGVFFLFLFRLRLIDDLKDLHHDQAFHSERPLARGLISQREIAYAVIVVLLIEFAIAAWFGGSALLFFGLGFIYATVLSLEAYYGDRLRKKFTLYILIHEIILLPMFVYLFLINGLSVSEIMQLPLIGALGFFTFIMFLIEVMRKIRATESESKGEDTYSYQYGRSNAVKLSLGIATISLGLLVWLTHFLTNSYTQPMIALLIGAAVALFFMYYIAFQFIAQNTKSTEKKLFVSSGIYTAVLLSVAATIFLL